MAEAGYNTDFNIMDCALIAIATGDKAQSLRELRDKLRTAHPGCLYFHFWAGMLRPSFLDPEFQNDFAVWTSRNMHDAKISEQLSLVDPNQYKNLEDLRREVLEVIEQRLYELDYVPMVKMGEEFHFIRSQTVIFETGMSIDEPRKFMDIIPNLSLGSIFYHFIDSRRRTEETKSDFSLWIQGFGDQYKELSERLDSIDPYFTTLGELRHELIKLFQNYFEGGEQWKA
jgi:septum formation topological specificity factor MinE